MSKFQFARDAKVSLQFMIVKETDKAINVGGDWFPKSQITIERIPGAEIKHRTCGMCPLAVVTVPVWLLLKNEMCTPGFIAKQLENPMTVERAIQNWNEVNLEKIGKAA